jgi:PIN domain nuclease of toxin-antitoxin system
VLDASALLAILNQEPGSAPYTPAVGESLISAVNFSEVIAKLADIGMDESEVRQVLEPLDLEVVPFDTPQAWAAGLLRPATRSAGLSFADRACVALATQAKLPALTIDHAWKRLRLPIQIRLLRP